MASSDGLRLESILRVFFPRSILIWQALHAPGEMRKDWRPVCSDDGRIYWEWERKRGSFVELAFQSDLLLSLALQPAVIFIFSKDVHSFEVLGEDGEALRQAIFCVLHFIAEKITDAKGLCAINVVETSKAVV